LTVPLGDSPPRVGGLPLAGNAFDMYRDPDAFLARCYRDHGPVFEITVPGRRLTVLAGPQAIAFCNAEGRHCLGAAGAYRQFYAAFDMLDFSLALDGAPHRQVRQLYTAGYGRQRAQDHLPDIRRIACEHARAHAGRKHVDLVVLLRRLVADQLGAVCMKMLPGGATDALARVASDYMQVHVEHSKPASLLRGRGHRARLQAIEHMAAAAVAGRSRYDALCRRDCLIDDLLAADPTGKQARTGVIGSYLAGIDNLAGTLAFLFAELLCRPQLMKLVRDEAYKAMPGVAVLDGADSSGHPVQTLSILRETMRVHPVSPLLPRVAIRDFDFAGRHVSAGTHILLAIAAADRPAFDLHRALHNDPGAPGDFAPYGAGPHACPAIGFAELSMVATVFALLTTVRITLADPCYRLRIARKPSPVPARLHVDFAKVSREA